MTVTGIVPVITSVPVPLHRNTTLGGWKPNTHNLVLKYFPDWVGLIGLEVFSFS